MQKDYIQQLADYFKKNLSKGYTAESLKWSLVSQGYSRSSVNRALQIANQQLAEKAPQMKEKPIIRYTVIGQEPNSHHKKSFWKKIKEIFI